MVKQLLLRTLTPALNTTAKHAQRVEPDNVDEATFRSFVVAELKRQRPDAMCYVEWQRIDLFLCVDDRRALIEFKYYWNRRKLRHNGRPSGYKGGPSKGNEDDFRRCVRKLSAYDVIPDAKKFVVLVYEAQHPPARHRLAFTYPASYKHLKPYGVATEQTIKHDHPDLFVCKLATVV